MTLIIMSVKTQLTKMGRNFNRLLQFYRQCHVGYYSIVLNGMGIERRTTADFI